MPDDPIAKPAVRALIDESGIEDEDLAGIAGGAGMATHGQPDARDTWSQTVYDHSLPVPASGPAPAASPHLDAARQVPAGVEVEAKRALLPGRGMAPAARHPTDTNEPAAPLPDPRSLFDPSKPDGIT